MSKEKDDFINEPWYEKYFVESKDRQLGLTSLGTAKFLSTHNHMPDHIGTIIRNDEIGEVFYYGDKHYILWYHNYPLLQDRQQAFVHLCSVVNGIVLNRIVHEAIMKLLDQSNNDDNGILQY